MPNYIVCLSTTPYLDPPTSKQEFMNRMETEVLYFDPAVTLLAPLADRKNFKRLFAFLKKGKQVRDHIINYSLPPMLPFYNRVRCVNKWNYFWLSLYIKSKMRKHHCADAMLWVYHPGHVDAIKRIQPRCLVYHCVDRHSAYKGQIDPALVDAMERELATRADIVFCTSAGLYNTLKEHNPNCHMIPNGSNYDIFSLAAAPLPEPEELKGLSRPILGFTGAFQECIDYAVMAAAANAVPGATLVLIGHKNPNADMSALDGMGNVKIIASMPQKRLVAYMAHFDVCLNPFKEGGLAMDVSSLKFYDYLSAGKPIASTPATRQVLDYAEIIYLGSGPEGFADACKRALAETGDELKNKRMEYGRLTSWDARAAEIKRILAERELD